MKRYLFTIATVYALFLCSLQAQVLTSPYSVFGIGILEDRGHGSSRAFGGAGIAVKSDRYLMNENPASYNSIDSLSFIFEAGFYGRFSKFSTSRIGQPLNDGNINYLSFGYRVNKWWAMSMGLVPYSSVNYYINSTDEIGGSLYEYPKIYEGKGGINRIYSGNSFSLFKGLSAGANLSYIFGTINKSEIIAGDDILGGYSFIQKENIYGFNWDIGIQYHLNINKWRYGAGAIFGNNQELNSKYSGYILIRNDSVKTETYTNSYNIPTKAGIGISLERTGWFRLAADIEKNYWGKQDLSLNSPIISARNTTRYSGGIEIFPLSSMQNQFKNSAFYLGGYYSENYLVLKGVNLDTHAFITGFSIPIGGGMNALKVTLEKGVSGTAQNGLIKEKYTQLNVNFTFHDIWFVKHKFD